MVRLSPSVRCSCSISSSSTRRSKVVRTLCTLRLGLPVLLSSIKTSPALIGKYTEVQLLFLINDVPLLLLKTAPTARHASPQHKRLNELEPRHGFLHKVSYTGTPGALDGLTSHGQSNYSIHNYSDSCNAGWQNTL